MTEQGYGKITAIDEVYSFKVEPVAPMNGADGARLGLGQMTNAVFGGYQSMDGYKVETDGHRFLVLIDNFQSCCEDWGYLASEDDVAALVGAELLKVEATDTSRLKEDVKETHYLNAGGVQFVDFVTDRGTFQLAVYNGHNGWYGHGILVAIDDEILVNGTL